MSELPFFVGGVALGIVATGGLLRFGRGRRVQRLRALLAPMVSAVPSETIEELRRDDPALAAVIQSRPAVPVESVPEEITAELQREVEAAATPEAAAAVVARGVDDPDLRRAVQLLIDWRTRVGNSEKQYQNSLAAFAKRNGYRGRIQERKRVDWAADGGKRPAHPDLILGDRVLIELKAQLEESSETDRAVGQMLRYLLAWKDKGPAVLAICGRVSPEFGYLLRTYIRAWRKDMQLPVALFIKRGNYSSSLEDAELEAEA